MGKSLRELADRCRAVANKVMYKNMDPAAQRIQRENPDHMKLARFVDSFSGFLGTQMRYQAPGDIGQVVSVAFAVHDAENVEKFNETFYTKFDNLVRLLSRSLWRSSRVYSKHRRRTHTQAAGHL